MDTLDGLVGLNAMLDQNEVPRYPLLPAIHIPPFFGGHGGVGIEVGIKTFLPAITLIHAVL